jgi:hypothetical protein
MSSGSPSTITLYSLTDLGTGKEVQAAFASEEAAKRYAQEQGIHQFQIKPFEVERSLIGSTLTQMPAPPSKSRTSEQK